MPAMPFPSKTATRPACLSVPITNSLSLSPALPAMPFRSEPYRNRPRRASPRLLFHARPNPNFTVPSLTQLVYFFRTRLIAEKNCQPILLIFFIFVLKDFKFVERIFSKKAAPAFVNLKVHRSLSGIRPIPLFGGQELDLQRLRCVFFCALQQLHRKHELTGELPCQIRY